MMYIMINFLLNVYCLVVTDEFVIDDQTTATTTLPPMDVAPQAIVRVAAFFWMQPVVGLTRVTLTW